MTLEEQADAAWVKNFKHVGADAREFLERVALEPCQYIDCLATPSGSRVLGFVKLHKLSTNVYRMVYIVQYPGGTELHLGEGEALFGDEPQKLEQQHGTSRMKPWQR